MRRYILPVLVLSLVVVSCGGSDDPPVSPVDTTPPGRINLGLSVTSSSSLTLTWLSPGDDDYTGTAAGYDARYAAGNSVSWDSMTVITGLPTPQAAWFAEEFIVTELAPETAYSFMIRTRDDTGNWSAISERVTATTFCIGDENWSNLGPYLGDVFASVVWNGSLIVGGDEMPVSRWTGSSWQALGQLLPNTGVRAMTVYGGDLVVAGYFSSIGGVAANTIAAYDGTTWRPLGLGLPDEGEDDTPPFVHALLSFEGGLIVGGQDITRAGTAAVRNIARWDGIAWQTMGDPVSSVAGLVEYQGSVIATTGEGVQEWNGSVWSVLGAGALGVQTLAVYNGELIAGGFFPDAGPIRAIARWSGSAWEQFGPEEWEEPEYGPGVTALLARNDELVARGSFQVAGGIAARTLARWDGSTWNAMGCAGIGDYRFLASFEQAVIVRRGGDLLQWTE